MGNRPTPFGQDPPICARCHLEGRGCCLLSPGGERQMFGLCPAEIEAVSRASGLAAKHFVVADEVDGEFMALTQAIHPVFAHVMPGGRRMRLAVTDGACFFLGPAGCRLPEDARPFYCRLYPFWFTEDDRLMVLSSDQCLAQERAVSWREVLARIGDDEGRLRDIFAQYLKLAGYK